MAPDTRPAFSSLFLKGVERFNDGKYWDAHESWERLWLRASPPMKQFLQGLIQLAAAYHHVRRGTLPGALRLFDSALAKLTPSPTAYCGVDRRSLAGEAQRDRESVASGHLEDVRFPRIPQPDPAAFPQEW